MSYRIRKFISNKFTRKQKPSARSTVSNNSARFVLYKEIVNNPEYKDKVHEFIKQHYRDRIAKYKPNIQDPNVINDYLRELFHDRFNKKTQKAFYNATYGKTNQNLKFEDFLKMRAPVIGSTLQYAKNSKALEFIYTPPEIAELKRNKLDSKKGNYSGTANRLITNHYFRLAREGKIHPGIPYENKSRLLEQLEKQLKYESSTNDSNKNFTRRAEIAKKILNIEQIPVLSVSV